MKKKYLFNYTKYKDKIIKILNELDKAEKLNASRFRKILCKYPKDGNKLFSKSHLVRGYKKILKDETVNENFSSDLLKKIVKKPVRTQSGVAIVTVLTKPYPCPGNCIFCPKEKGMPKSYLSDEPGAQRAKRNKFNPYLQTYRRIKALKNMGHNIEKIELIILGGTWTSYPLDYQIWFIKKCFEAMNDFDSKEVDLQKIEKNIGLQIENSNWQELFKEHKKNEIAKCRCVGLVVETRPDEIKQKIALNLRKLGCTKIQIGIQSLNEKVLDLNQRGHTIKEIRKAFKVLRLTGFKIHAHWMPNLYGSNLEKDIQDFNRIFNDPSFRPDELKIYPCSLIKGTKLMNFYKKNKWKPYTHKELLEILIHVFKKTPRYCRVTRVIRDIPAGDIFVGNKLSNFRQIVNDRLEELNIKSKEIRTREIKLKNVKKESLELKTTKYLVSGGEEFFLEFINTRDEIAGFLRLFLPNNKKHAFIDELDNSAIIREIHVYGKALNVGNNIKGKAQHIGLGKSLISTAEIIARECGYKNLAVIASVGTREYYRNKGFSDGRMYQYFVL